MTAITNFAPPPKHLLEDLGAFRPEKYEGRIVNKRDPLLAMQLGMGGPNNQASSPIPPDGAPKAEILHRAAGSMHDQADSASRKMIDLLA